MNIKNINKNQENQSEINENNTQNQFSQSGITLEMTIVTGAQVE